MNKAEYIRNYIEKNRGSLTAKARAYRNTDAYKPRMRSLVSVNR